MASLKQITVGTTSYNIIPNAITDSNANYKASCPAISSDTTVEVASNKTTVIDSSSTDTEYPSAKAVYTAIQKASKAGTFASNIYTSDNTDQVPLISTGGMFQIKYLSQLQVQPGKSMQSVVIDGTGAINSMWCTGTIGTILLDKSTGYNTTGHISKISLNATDNYIGDSTIPTESETTLGQNGLYGSGTVYIPATGTSDPSSSGYAFKGSIVNKAGVSSSVQGGYINKIINDKYATIENIATYGGTIKELSIQNRYTTMGTIEKLYINNGGKIERLIIHDSYISYLYMSPANGAYNYIGDPIIPTADNITAGQKGLYGSGNIYIAATGASDPSTSAYAFTGSIINKAGASDSIKGGYIGSIRNDEYATIGSIENNGTIKRIALNSNITRIGDSTIPIENNPAIGQNGLYGSGIVYIAATGASDPSTSTYAFKGSIINKAGASNSVMGGYIETISNGSYATINKIFNTNASGKINYIHNTGTIADMINDGDGHIKTLSMGGHGTADILVPQTQGNKANINLGISSTYPLWGVVANGKISPWQEVSTVESLVNFLNLQTGILYKYTGSTTTYNGVTYTNGNFYRYEA